LLVGLFSSQANAENSALDQKKIVIVSKFIKHTQWPEEAIETNFILGVYGDVDLYSLFSESFQNKAINGKDIEVILIDSVNQAKQAHLVYIAENKNRDLPKLAKKTRGYPVVLMSENDKNPQDSMVSLLFNEDESKIDIKVNYANINEKGLQVPEVSTFLNTGDDQNILSLSKKAIAENKFNKELSTLKKYILTQKNQLSQLKEQLNLSEEKLAKYKLALTQQTNKLKSAENEAEQQKSALSNAKQKLTKLTNELKAKDQQLAMTKEEWLGAEADNAKVQEEKIKVLTENLAKQEKIVKAQRAKLTAAEQKSQQLSSYATLFYSASAVAIFAFIIALFIWLRNKKSTKAIAEAKKAVSDAQEKLAAREQQLIKSENTASIGFVASDVTFAAGTATEKALDHSIEINDEKNTQILKPAVTLLENFNQIAADQDEEEKQSFDLAEYVNKVMTLFSVEFKASNIHYLYAGETSLEVESIPGHISLVILNLVNNSIRHGFNNEGKGKISILIEKTPQGGAKLIYQDNGVGMDKNTLEKVYEPFFTTKPERDYSGLGMSIVYDLIKNKLNGDIKLQSQVNKGTTITITL
jgi:signal transduction histidine kinase